MIFLFPIAFLLLIWAYFDLRSLQKKGASVAMWLMPIVFYAIIYASNYAVYLTLNPIILSAAPFVLLLIFYVLYRNFVVQQMRKNPQPPQTADASSNKLFWAMMIIFLLYTLVLVSGPIIGLR